MQGQQPYLSSSWPKTLRGAAAVGAALTLVYAQAFTVYAIMRSSLTISATDYIGAPMLPTLVANATTILLASASTALALCLLTAPLGMITGAAIKATLAWLNHGHSAGRSLWIGFAAALAVVVSLQFALGQAFHTPVTTFGAETYLFWFGLPGLLHICAGMAGAWYLNRQAVSLPFT